MRLRFRKCGFLHSPVTFAILGPNNLLVPCCQIITLCPSCMWETEFRIHIKHHVNRIFTYFNICVFRCETDQSSFSVTGFLCIATDVPSIASEVFLHTEFEAFAHYRVGSGSRIFFCHFLSVPILTSWGSISRKLLQLGLTCTWLARKRDTSPESRSVSASKMSALPKQLSYLTYVDHTS
jgi:hypothetical protein